MPWISYTKNTTAKRFRLDRGLDGQIKTKLEQRLFAAGPGKLLGVSLIVRRNPPEVHALPISGLPADEYLPYRLDRAPGTRRGGTTA